MPESTSEWKHIITLNDGQSFKINGLNIWDNEWKDTRETIQVKDPLYGQDHTFSVFEITNGQTTVTFAAGEFSNCVWGIYQK